MEVELFWLKEIDKDFIAEAAKALNYEELGVEGGKVVGKNIFIEIFCRNMYNQIK